MNPDIRLLLQPGPAEVLRAAQKDDEYSKKLSTDVQDLFQRVFGQRAAQKWYRCFAPTSVALYHTLTSFAGFQTLGEEYTGILQVDQSGRRTPRKFAIAVAVMLMIFGHPILETIIDCMLNSSSKAILVGTPSLTKRETIVLQIHELLQIIKHYASFFGQIHLALFYLQGTFYHVSKRFLGIQYLLVRRSLAAHDSASRKILRYLMWASIINSLLIGIQDSITYGRRNRTNQLLDNEFKPSPQDNISSDPAKKCTLCLDTRKNTSVTPCGHLFCWNCIMDWLRTKSECPICREQFSPSRIVPLQNFR